ncbi:Activating signal cointegrator 1 complex subunit [Trichostrongylus colubriformis]|uniref:Activating signal cointegrator 1 complex subunit n=1 Tax=Trichostrongylus colubriformis TaxID=6319 RepID=A0AAN8J0D1_TRICO
MKRVKEFRAKVDDIATSRIPLSDGISSSNGAMTSLFPFHPKSVAAAKENEGEHEGFNNIFDRFRSDLLTSLKGQTRMIKHELCSALRLLESVIRLIADSEVHYRMLMAVNIFKNVKDKITDGERDQAKAGLFPSADDYVEDSAKLIADVVAQIRSIVGMKQLHEAIAVSWNVARSGEAGIPDPVVAGPSEQILRYFCRF